MPYVLYGIILIALIILVRNIRIVPQAQAYVITRLGAYKTTWGVGLHLKIPFIESVAKRLSLKEQVADFPPQPVITKDNVTMQTPSSTTRSPTRSSTPMASSSRSLRLRTSRPRRCATSSATWSLTSA